MSPLLQSFGGELLKLADRTIRVQSSPREFAKLTPAFKKLTRSQQKTERVAPGAYTHRAPAKPASRRGFLAGYGESGPGSTWLKYELAKLRSGEHGLAKVKAKPRPGPAPVAAKPVVRK